MSSTHFDSQVADGEKEVAEGEQKVFYPLPWLDLKVCFAIGVAAVLATVLLLIVLGAGLPVWVGIVIGLLPGLFAFTVANSIRKSARKYKTMQWQMNAGIDGEGLWVSLRTASRYMHVLTKDEKRIRLITRFHSAKLVASFAGHEEVGFWSLLGAIFRLSARLILVLLLLGALTVGVVDWVLPWWLLPVAFIFLVIAIWAATIKQFYTVFILTDYNAHLVFQPPVLVAPLMRAYQPVLSLRKIDTWDKVESSVANLFGMKYGTFIMDSPSEQDAVFNNLRFMPRLDEVLLIAGGLIQSAQNMMPAGAKLSDE